MPRFEDLAAEGQALVEVGGAVVGVDVATQAELDAVDAAKAPLESPALTGTPTVPTAPAGTNTTQAASTAFVKGEVDNASGGIARTRWQSGQPYGPPANSLTSTIYGADSLVLVPFYIDVDSSITAIGIEVTSAGVDLRFGIYNDNGSGLPSTLLVDAGTASAGATGFTSVSVAQALPADLYWVGVVSQGGSVGVRTVVGYQPPLPTDGSSSLNNSYVTSGVSGALPGSIVSPAGFNAAPFIIVIAGN